MNNLSFFSKGLFIREVGRDKKQDGTIFFPSSYGDFWDEITRQDGMISVPPFRTRIT